MPGICMVCGQDVTEANIYACQGTPEGGCVWKAEAVEGADTTEDEQFDLLGEVVERSPLGLRKSSCGTSSVSTASASIPVDNIKPELLAPKLTPEDIEAVIVEEHYFTAADGSFAVAGQRPTALPDDPLAHVTFCVLLLLNGAKVTGVNHGPVSSANFDAAKGREYARKNAIEKVWELEGYALRERLANPQAVLVGVGVGHRALAALRTAVDAMRAFTDPEGNMLAETGEFNDLKAALVEAEGVLEGAA